MEFQDATWIGTDEEGRVGVFFTGGQGPIRETSFISNADQYRIEDLLLELRRTSVSSLYIPYKRPDDYVAMAERGLYAFDWTDAHRVSSAERNVYKLVAEPSQPLNVAQLPDSLRRLGRATKIQGEGAHFPQARDCGVRV
jgi:hypothetical protein